MDTIESVFLETLKRENLLPPGSPVTAAVSGGADSMALLHLLHRFSGARGWKLKALHIDHRLRPGSKEDASFVVEACGRLEVPCRVERPGRAPAGSMESRWSRVRHEIYTREGATVAVGHTMSDRAETVLLRLIEGSGLRGLGGMDYRGRGPVIRPLLDLHREQVRKFLAARDIPWREDESNLDPSLSRNRIRISLMPVLEDCFPHGARGLSRSSAVLAAWRDLQGFLAEVLEEPLSRDEYARLPRVLRLTALWAMAGKPRSGTPEFLKIDSWLMSGGTGEHLLPGGLKLRADIGSLSVHARKGRFG